MASVGQKKPKKQKTYKTLPEKIKASTLLGNYGLSHACSSLTHWTALLAKFSMLAGLSAGAASKFRTLLDSVYSMPNPGIR
jgi:hypothetical protein